MAKKRKTYTADEMSCIKVRLVCHKGTLVGKMSELIESFERTASGDLLIPTCNHFDVAVEMRDAAQQLVSTCNALSLIDMLMSNAEALGPKCLPFDAEDIGLDL